MFQMSENSHGTGFLNRTFKDGFWFEKMRLTSEMD